MLIVFTCELKEWLLKLGYLKLWIYFIKQMEFTIQKRLMNWYLNLKKNIPKIKNNSINFYKMWVIRGLVKKKKV